MSVGRTPVSNIMSDLRRTVALFGSASSRIAASSDQPLLACHVRELRLAAAGVRCM
jgi:hypothetical protein